MEINPVDFIDPYVDDFPLYCHEVLKIKTDFTAGKTDIGETAIIPLDLTRAQRIVWEEDIKPDLVALRPVRLMICKSRRATMSTLCCALMYRHASVWENQNCFILANNQTTSENLHDIVKIFYKFSPPHLQPMYRIFNRREIHFANPDPKSPVKGLESRIRNDSIDDKDIGASFAVQFLLFSEASRFESAGRNIHAVMESIMPTVPRKPFTYVIYESTAEEGGEFFRTKFLDKNDSYRKRFLSFICDDTNRVENEYAFELSALDDSEYGNEYAAADLIKKEIIKWYPELRGRDEAIRHEVYCRLAWRRLKIKEPECHGDPNTFARIYPLSADEAFRGNIVGVFPAYRLVEQQKVAEDGERTGQYPGGFWIHGKKYFNEVGKIDDWKSLLIDEITDAGCLHIWEPPLPNVEYFIGADPSLGLEHGDKSGMVLLKGTHPLIECATWNDSIRPDLFALLLYAVGAWYNWALIGVETNSMGYTTFNDLLRTHYYPMVFQRPTLDNKLTVDVTDNFGWLTNDRTKHQMVTEMRTAMVNREIYLRSPESISEFLLYQKMPNGRLGIPDGTVKGRSANLVMAGCIALQMTKQIHMISEPKKPIANSRFTREWALRRVEELQRDKPFRTNPFRSARKS